MRTVCVVIAILLFGIASVIAFGWFGIEHTPDTIANVLGLIAGGLAFLAVSFLPPAPHYFR